MDRIFNVSWLPWIKINVCRKCLIRSHFKPSGKKSPLYTPFPFGDLPLSHPSTPWNFRDPPWGGGVWIFSGTTQSMQTCRMSSKQVFGGNCEHRLHLVFSYVSGCRQTSHTPVLELGAKSVANIYAHHRNLITKPISCCHSCLLYTSPSPRDA